MDVKQAIKVEELDTIKPSNSGEVLFPHTNQYSHIRNKIIRNQKFQKIKRELKKSKKKVNQERKQRGESKQPHTLETLRIKDETTVEDLNSEENSIVKHDLDSDEFKDFYSKTYEPKVLITFCDNPMKKTRIFGRELTRIIPNSMSVYRNRCGIKKMVKSAIKENYTDIIVINEHKKEPDGLLVIHLPEGPTAHFKLSNVKITTELRKNHKEINAQRPEVVLNNFTTRLGLTVGRMLGALFHYDPEFTGRRAVTFHNQRDYIFFRHYKYTFDSDGRRARLKELGPRFTLRLKSLQKGTFDSKYGEYEWIIQGRRHDMETSRRKFFL
ncbi:u3 small nucleolar ribonucleoprotein imp4 [Holotrichia oblita]|uniref:U3 small nucleolar ribonucleoprotein imp4 n=1 Tax=Holotrichia oblita TaxID=644536 RepID=A0ACB9TW56_HOLOL|nr:u3 small nucleolar ribonucleoprotein imp4 [Holotrichia oblita]